MTTAAHTDDPAPVKVSGPAGLIAAIPTLLGFHPAESLVLVCLSGPRRRMGPVARVDLPRGRSGGLAAMLVGHADRYADEVAVVVYTQRRRPPILGELLGQLRAARIPIMDVLSVRDGLIRPARSADAERRHPGEPIPAVTDAQVEALGAAAALSGRLVLPDRDALAQSIAGPTGDRLRMAEDALDQAVAQFPASGAGPGSAMVSPDEHVLLSLADRVLAEAGTPGGVTVQTAAGLAVLSCDVALRDTLIAWAVSEPDEPWVPALIGCATWTPDALAAPLCSVLAVAAYRHGDGALAQLAVDRCLAAEPGHSLAHLMLAMMAAGLPPEDLVALAADPGAAAGPDG